MEIVRETEHENAEMAKRIDFIAMAPGVFYIPRSNLTFVYKKSNDMWFMNKSHWNKSKLVRVSEEERLEAEEGRKNGPLVLDSEKDKESSPKV